MRGSALHEMDCRRRLVEVLERNGGRMLCSELIKSLKDNLSTEEGLFTTYSCTIRVFICIIVASNRIYIQSLGVVGDNKCCRNIFSIDFSGSVRNIHYHL